MDIAAKKTRSTSRIPARSRRRPAVVARATCRSTLLTDEQRRIAGLNSPTVEYPFDEWERVLRVISPASSCAAARSRRTW